MKIIVVAVLLLITPLTSLAPGTELGSELSVLKSEELRSQFKAVIYTDKAKLSRALVPGYNYYLLRSYAKNTGQNPQIDISYGDMSYVDSLKAGIIDMLAITFSDNNLVEPVDSEIYFSDSLLSCYTADSSSVWLMRKTDRKNMKQFSSWLKERELEEGHEEIKALYFKRYNAFRSRPRTHLSPYDSLIRANAHSIGIDWRFLAALIYQESRFHIEAVSHKGARGIMQMIPKTAEEYGVVDPLDPELNIKGGAQLFKDLLRHYRGIAANKEENYKFALGAYNAGCGRVDDMITLSRMQNMEYSYWDKLVKILPQMEKGYQVDSSITKTFYGSETVAYVEDVIDIYKEFLRICPE